MAKQRKKSQPNKIKIRSLRVYDVPINKQGALTTEGALSSKDIEDSMITIDVGNGISIVVWANHLGGVVQYRTEDLKSRLATDPADKEEEEETI
jgi:hypothetical protein